MYGDTSTTITDIFNHYIFEGDDPNQYAILKFKICPTVERIQLLLTFLNFDFNITWKEVDIRNKPEWYIRLGELSNQKLTVPAWVDRQNESVLCDSNALSIRLDDLSSNHLHPQETALREENEQWLQFCNKLMQTAYQFSVLSGTKEISAAHQKELSQQLQKLESRLQKSNPQFFNDDTPSLVDIAYAPQLKRFETLERLCSITIMDESKYPAIKKWGNNVLALDAVQNQYDAEFDNNLKELLTLKKSWLTPRFGQRAKR